MPDRRPSTRSFRLMLVYQLSQHVPLYWPYMFMYVTSVRGLPASDFGLLKSIYYFGVMAAEVPLGVVADRLGRRTTLFVAALANCVACALYAKGAEFSVFAAAEVLFALTTALQSGADSALLFDAYTADDRAHEFARAKGILEASGLVAGTAAFSLAGLLVSGDGDATVLYLVTGTLSLAGAAAAFALREPPRVATVRMRRHVANALRDLVRTPGLIAILAYGALAYAAIRAANALVWNPVLEAAGMPVGIYGALTGVVSLLGALAAWRTDAWRRSVGATALALSVAASLAGMYALLALAPGWWSVPILLTHGVALGVTPVLLVDQLNRRIVASERRATLLSFESMFQRGTYGVLVYAAASALDTSSLSTVLLGFAVICVVPLVLAVRIRDVASETPNAR
jgi:MFS family permease